VGMRNSNTMAIAPTATISNICGVSQSIEPTYQNLYVAEASGPKLDALYKLAWRRGLKTTYYLRTLGATHVEKTALRDSEQGAPQDSPPKACSILDPDCEACQ